MGGGIAGRFEEFVAANDAGTVHRGGDLEHVGAFGHGHLVIVNIASRQAIEHSPGGGRAGKAILARL